MAFRIGLLFLAVFLLLRSPMMAQDLPVDQQLPPVAAPTHRVVVNQLPVLDTTPAFNPKPPLRNGWRAEPRGAGQIG